MLRGLVAFDAAEIAATDATSHAAKRLASVTQHHRQPFA
jgi:hypothetical protein